VFCIPIVVSVLILIKRLLGTIAGSFDTFEARERFRNLPKPLELLEGVALGEKITVSFKVSNF
jgi:hypothetical protein